jgi:pilus assembly protein Flp/PilA
MKKLINFFKEEKGATAVEYGIMVAAIAAVIITAVIAIGDQTNTAFEGVESALGELNTPS